MPRPPSQAPCEWPSDPGPHTEVFLALDFFRPLRWRRPQIFLTYLPFTPLNSHSIIKTEHHKTEELGDRDTKTMTITLRKGLWIHPFHKHSGVCRGCLCSHTRTPAP